MLWRASDKTWRAAVADAWEIKSLAGHPERVLDRGDIPTDRTRASESELPEPVPGWGDGTALQHGSVLRCGCGSVDLYLLMADGATGKFLAANVSLAEAWPILKPWGKKNGGGC